VNIASRWLKVRRKVLNKDSHPAVVEQDCPEINSSQRWCFCKNARVVLRHGDLGSRRSSFSSWAEQWRTIPVEESIRMTEDIDK